MATKDQAIALTKLVDKSVDKTTVKTTRDKQNERSPNRLAVLTRSLIAFPLFLVFFVL